MAQSKQDVEKQAAQNRLEAERIRSEADKEVSSIELKKALLDAVSSKIVATAPTKQGLSTAQIALLVAVPVGILVMVLVVIGTRKKTENG